MGKLYANERTVYYDDEVRGRLYGNEALSAWAEDVQARAEAAMPSDIGSPVTLTAQAYSTVVADLSRMLEVETGATDAVITLLAADAAGDDAIQQIRKSDTAAGRVIIMAAGVCVAILAAQHEVAAMRSNGTVWFPLRYRGRSGLLAKSGVQILAPGDTVENVLATIPIPAGAIGPNGSVEVDTLWSMTNNANVKTGRVRLGGVGGPGIGSVTLTSFASARVLSKFWNRNAENAQTFFLGGSGVGTSGTALGTAAVDTSVARDLVITGQKATAGDVLALEAYEVRLT